MTPLILLPQPQSVTIHGGTIAPATTKLIAIADPDQLRGAQRLQAMLERKLNIRWEIVADSVALPEEQIGVRFDLNPSYSNHQDAYQMEIAASVITVMGTSLPALWYGTCTLIQIIEQANPDLPLLTIDDWADFPRRGVMLDIARDKVPTMETLFALVDRLATWKINELQLYSEHTFAYRQHPDVWAKASPMTAEQIMELDQFCAERYIDLVPNQNSFGHMHRWLIHDRYRPLAEVPEGLDWPMFLSPRPFSLAAVDLGSMELIAGLYDELLPNFSSPYFNVGCDETLDLGQGRSHDLCEQMGKGRVYLDFLKKIQGLVQSHGRTMMFWGDIIIGHPELVPELPKDLIALEWGYEADHPFDANSAQFASTGIQFYVCPGTSSWLSLVGRTANAVGNLQNAAVNGKKHGATGYLITDWGDYGHLQSLPVSYLGFAYGAALAWAVEANQEIDLPAALDLFAFEDSTHTMGKIAYELGNIYRIVDTRLHNSSTMGRILVTPLDAVRAKPWTSQIDKVPITIEVDKVRAALAEADRLEAQLDQAQPADPLVIPEYKLALALWRHGAKRLLMLQNDPEITNEVMAAELRSLIERYRDLWVKRNRPGGLDDSVTRLQRRLADYEA